MARSVVVVGVDFGFAEVHDAEVEIDAHAVAHVQRTAEADADVGMDLVAAKVQVQDAFRVRGDGLDVLVGDAEALVGLVFFQLVAEVGRGLEEIFVLGHHGAEGEVESALFAGIEIHEEMGTEVIDRQA